MSNSRTGYSYSPLANLRYVWQTGQDYSTKNVGTSFSTSVIGFIPGNSGSYNSLVSTPQSATPLGIGEYQAVGAQGNRYQYGFQNLTTSVSNATRRDWSECATRIIVCVSTRYYVEDTWYVGTSALFSELTSVASG